MKNFEEKLERLEKISSDIKKSDVTLEEALKYFEEGITLARTMEKELDKIEGKIQILMTEQLQISVSMIKLLKNPKYFLL